MIKRILIALSLIFLLFLGAIFILPGLVPTDSYREKLEAELSRSLARDVSITGEIKISTFPSIAIQTDGVSLANPDGFSAETFMKVDGMLAKVRLLPLISKRVEISGIEFDSPVISLEKRADGEVNWALGDPATETPETKDNGPFKRDGRYTDYDPSLKLLRIKNGNINYKDETKGQSHVLSNVNLDLRAPALSQPLKLDGDFTFDDLAVSLSGALESPADFLNGKATNFDADIKTVEASVDVDGQFAASQDLVFSANFGAESKMPLTAAKRFHLPDDLDLPPLTNVNVSGDINYDGKADFPNIDAKVNGQGFNVSYEGQLDLGDDLSGQGKFSADVTDKSILTPYLKEPIQALDAIDAFNVTGDVKWSDKTYALSDMLANVAGPGLSTSYQGDANYGEKLSAKGNFEADVEDLPNFLNRIGQSQPDAAALKRVAAKGNISLDGKALSLTNLSANTTDGAANGQFTGNVSFNEILSVNGGFEASVADVPALLKTINRDRPEAAALKLISAKGDIALLDKKVSLTNFNARSAEGSANGEFSGSLNYDEALNLNGTFDASVSDLPELLTLIGQSQPDAAALKRVSASGNIAMVGGRTTLSSLTALASEGLANGEYNGDINYDDALSLKGQMRADIPDLAALDAALERELPYSEVAKRVSISSNISTVSDTYQLSNLSARLEDGRLNGSFDGRLAIGDAPDLNGNLVISAASLREIAVSQNVQLPPNTDLGPIFESMNFSGQVSGTASKIAFKSGTIQLDNLSGTGDFTLDIAETKPSITGTIALGVMDLRPYMSAWSAQRPTGQIMPWSTSSIDLAALSSANARINITSPSILTDRIELGQTDSLLTLQNGTLKAQLNQTQLYEGTAKGAVSISNATGRPSLSIQTDIRDVAAQSFLAATGGFDKVAGLADFNFDIQGTGSSQADIMRNLNGDGTFTILNGQITAIDAEALASGFDQALSNQQVPSGIGLGNSTNFDDLNGSFTVSNGVATIAGFELTSGNLVMAGEGQIDLGNQTLDIGFRPKLQGGSNLAGVGVPLRFSGKFGQAKAGLDSGALTDIATARARDLAAKEIKDRIGGSLGGTLGGLIGGNSQSSTDDSTQSGTSGSGTSSSGGLGDIVGGIFGGSSSSTTPQPDPSETQQAEPAEAPAPEPTPEEKIEDKVEDEIENALKGIFGRKKKK